MLSVIIGNISWVQAGLVQVYHKAMLWKVISITRLLTSDPVLPTEGKLPTNKKNLFKNNKKEPVARMQ